jgi:beta-glucanase (GH16 family)
MATTLDLSQFHLSYDDEFNSFTSSPDGSSGYQTTFYFGGRSLPSNGEQEFYSDSSVGVNPFSQSNGQLTITASPGSNPGGLWYNSGLITTEGDFTQTYGYFEIRADLPQGQGMWPAFWLLPADKSWPPEIDALEAFGQTNANGEGGANSVHVGAITSDWASGGGGSWVNMPGGADITAGYHTYGVDWEPDFVTYYIDGQQVFQVKTPSDMNKPMYMLANLAVGGNWVGSAAGETGQMSIDYIRAYSKDPNVTTVAQQTVSSPDGASTGNPGGGTVTPPSPPPTGTGSGPDSLTVRVAEDAFNGDAKFTVFVDGVQVGGTQTATASHGAGQWQDITLNGTFGAGPHNVVVNYVNDAWGGNLSADRNLYVQSVSLNGETIAAAQANNMAANGTHPADGSAELAINGAVQFATTGSGTTTPPPTDPTPPTTDPTPPTTDPTPPATSGLTVRVAEDAFNGNAQFIVKVDGQQVGGTYTATASHMSGEWQDVTVDGTFAAGPHDVAIQFVNDTWGGSTMTDRNLYVQSITLNGETISTPTANTAANGMHPADGSAELATNGTSTYHATGTGVSPPTTDPTPPTTDPTPPSTSSGLHISVSEDAFNGDAQFKVLVDGHQVGGTYTATASWAAGQWQDVTVDGTFAAGPHTVDVQFINDNYGGTASTDRNLYVQSVSLNGETVAGSSATDNAANGVHPADGSAAMMTNGDSVFHMTGMGTTTPTPPTTDPTPPTTDPTPPATTLSTIVLHVSEDAFNGDAQFMVLVDGQQVGGIQTATASHAAGQWQDITLTGDFGTTGPGKVDIQFTNDQWGGNASTDRNLYVQSIDVNGQNFAASTATNNAANGTHPADGSAELAINGTLDFNVNHTATLTDMHLV